VPTTVTVWLSWRSEVAPVTCFVTTVPDVKSIVTEQLPVLIVIAVVEMLVILPRATAFAPAAAALDPGLGHAVPPPANVPVPFPPRGKPPPLPVLPVLLLLFELAALTLFCPTL
jgi:hypothetical protein